MKAYNFNAGPCVLPKQAIESAIEAIRDFDNTGIGILEISHRTPGWERIMAETEQLWRELLNIPEDYAVMFLGGGASTQFFEVPANLLKTKAAYLQTGVWAKKAIKEAKFYGEGEGVACLLGWRGLAQPAEVQVQAINLKDGLVVAQQVAVPVPSTMLPRRQCSFTALPPGEYLLRAESQGTPAPECRLTVRPLPRERDNLNSDPELLRRVADSTGGKVLPIQLSDEHLAHIFAMPPGVRATESVYCPLWARWQVLAFMVGCLGIVWFIRRRKGLA